MKYAITAAAATLLMAQTAAAQWNRKANAWYLKTIAETKSGFVDDRSGIIGRIPGGSEGYDIHDIRAFESVNGAPVAVISVRGPEWGERSGEYLSDYREPGRKNGKAWDFVVTTNKDRETVTLSWEGLFVIEQSENGGFETELDNRNRVLRSLRLIDLERGRVVARGVDKRGKLQTYKFRMRKNTYERAFRWVQGRPTGEQKTLSSFVTLEEVSPFMLSPAAARSESFSSEKMSTLDSGAGSSQMPPAIQKRP